MISNQDRPYRLLPTEAVVTIPPPHPQAVCSSYRILPPSQRIFVSNMCILDDVEFVLLWWCNVVMLVVMVVLVVVVGGRGRMLLGLGWM